MNISEALYGAMADMIRKTTDADVDVVYGFEQDSRRVGACETCSYTETYVSIWYRTADGTSMVHEYVGDLGQLIRALTD